MQLNSAWLEACAAVNGRDDPFGGRRIACEVASEFGFTFRELASARRSRKLCRARHKAMWRMQNETIMCPRQIGDLLNRDRTTVVQMGKLYAARMARGEV